MFATRPAVKVNPQRRDTLCQRFAASAAAVNRSSPRMLDAFRVRSVLLARVHAAASIPVMLPTLDVAFLFATA